MKYDITAAAQIASKVSNTKNLFSPEEAAAAAAKVAQILKCSWRDFSRTYTLICLSDLEMTVIIRILRDRFKFEEIFGQCVSLLFCLRQKCFLFYLLLVEKLISCKDVKTLQSKHLICVSGGRQCGDNDRRTNKKQPANTQAHNAERCHNKCFKYSPVDAAAAFLPTFHFSWLSFWKYSVYGACDSQSVAINVNFSHVLHQTDCCHRCCCLLFFLLPHKNKKTIALGAMTF